jgi:hypothetical protein
MAPAHVGSNGQVYAALLMPNGAVFMLSAGGFSQLGSTPGVPFMYAGKLGTHYPMHLGSNQNFDSLAGAVLLTGYGVGDGDAALIDMLNNSRFGIALVLK